MAAWVKKSKKLQKQRAREIELARQREAEQEERDRAVYGEGKCSGPMQARFIGTDARWV